MNQFSFTKLLKIVAVSCSKLIRFLRNNGFAGNIEGWFGFFFYVRAIGILKVTEQLSMPSILLKTKKGEWHLVPNL